MALIWVEGFDALTNATGIARRYETFTGAFSSQSAASGISLASGRAACAQSNATVALTAPLVAAPVNTVVLGFAFRAGLTQGMSEGAGFAFHNDAGEQLRLEINDTAAGLPGVASAQFRILRGATVLATTSKSFHTPSTDNTASWLWCELKATIGGVGSFELRVSRIGGLPEVLAWDSPNTGVNTQNQGTAGVNRLETKFSNVGLHTVLFDEIYMLDTSGTALNDFVGNMVFERLDLVGDGNQTDWGVATASSTEDALDDFPSVVNDAKRITSDVVGDVSLVTVGAPLLATSSLAAVVVSQHARMESATGSLTIGFRYRSGGTESTGDNYTVSTTTPLAFDDFLSLDPVTGAPWVAADINSYQFGAINLG